MLPLTNPEYGTIIEKLGPVIIGLAAALVGWIVNQLVIKRWENFRAENRVIALERLERAYQPLYYLLGKLLLEMQSKGDTSFTKKRVSEIYENCGHLLKEEVENSIFAFLFMKDPNLEKLGEIQNNLKREVEILKSLVYSNYKLYENYYTTHFLGKIKLFLQALQFKIFSILFIIGFLFLIGYIAFRSLSVLVIILSIYLFFSSCLYLIIDYRKARLRRRY
jgi:hypothetical protein